MTQTDRVVDLQIEPVREADLPELTTFALEHTEPRIASYALEPRNAARRARLMAVLAYVPILGRRASSTPTAFWIVSGGTRGGFFLLDDLATWIHLHFIVLAPTLQGTGAADRALAFIEERARGRGARGVDLYVDRRNYRAYHFYLRRGFTLATERRYVFEVARAEGPGVQAIASLPWHAAAEALGVIGARALGARTEGTSMTMRAGGVAAITVGAPGDVGPAVRAAFRNTLARRALVTLPTAANVPSGRLVAILQRMEKVVS